MPTKDILERRLTKLVKLLQHLLHGMMAEKLLSDHDAPKPDTILVLIDIQNGPSDSVKPYRLPIKLGDERKVKALERDAVRRLAAFKRNRGSGGLQNPCAYQQVAERGWHIYVIVAGLPPQHAAFLAQFIAKEIRSDAYTIIAVEELAAIG